MPAEADWEFCGSWRRQAPDLGDIDIMVVTPDGSFGSAFCFPEAVQLIEITDSGRIQNAKGIIVLGRTMVLVDFWAVTPSMRGAFLMFFTGPRELNRLQRYRARARGLRLARHGLFDASGRQADNGTEADIYRLLGMPWIPPERRQEWAHIPEAVWRA